MKPGGFYDRHTKLVDTLVLAGIFSVMIIDAVFLGLLVASADASAMTLPNEDQTDIVIIPHDVYADPGIFSQEKPEAQDVEPASETAEDDDLASEAAEDEYVAWAMSSGYSNPFMQSGDEWDEQGRHYTWYSQRQLAGGGLTELNSNGRHVDESTGFIVDGDGYLAVAVPSQEAGNYSIGDVVETPWGEAKVYDHNSGDSWDMYTDF